MTGKDLTLFIINNNLMDVEVEIKPDDNGIFQTAEKTAVNLGISTTSVLDMARLGIIDSIDVDGELYFYKNIDLQQAIKNKKEIV